MPLPRRCLHSPTTFGIAHAPCYTRAERATQSAARVGSSLFDFLTVPSTHYVPKIVFTFSPICRDCKNSIAIYLIIMRDLNFFTRGQFWPPGIVVAPVRLSVRHQVCPRDNSSPVQARITKFGPKMQNTLVKVPIVFGGNQPWPSRSNLRSKSKFTPFWACPHHNSSPIQARITKFGPEVQNTKIKIPIVLGGNWPWPSWSNLT